MGTQGQITIDALELAAALKLELKFPSCVRCKSIHKGECRLPDAEVLELAASLDYESSDDIDTEIASAWTCEDCGKADTSVAWSVRFEASLCMGCEEAAIEAARAVWYGARRGVSSVM